MSAFVRFGSGPGLLVVYTLASSLGLLLIKSGLAGTAPMSLATFAAALTSARFVVGFCLYVLSFAAWIGVLAAMPLSTAYPLAIGLTMACSTIGARVLFGEALGWAKLGGMALVLGAVLLFTSDSWR